MMIENWTYRQLLPRWCRRLLLRWRSGWWLGLWCNRRWWIYRCWWMCGDRCSRRWWCHYLVCPLLERDRKKKHARKLKLTNGPNRDDIPIDPIILNWLTVGVNISVDVNMVCIALPTIVSFWIAGLCCECGWCAASCWLYITGECGAPAWAETPVPRNVLIGGSVCCRERKREKKTNTVYKRQKLSQNVNYSQKENQRK